MCVQRIMLKSLSAQVSRRRQGVAHRLVVLGLEYPEDATDVEQGQNLPALLPMRFQVQNCSIFRFYARDK